jgi:hypothetical protein
MIEKKIIFNCKTNEKEIIEVKLTQEEVEEKEKVANNFNIKNQIQELKDYLNSTDYAIIKMYETTIQGGSIIEMLKEYKEILTQRKEARQQINELEKGEAQNGN